MFSSDDDDDDDDDDDEVLSMSQNYWNIIKFYLHDAVYLYLLTLNQTLAEGHTNYRDGYHIINKTIGQRFAGKHSTMKITNLLVDQNTV